MFMNVSHYTPDVEKLADLFGLMSQPSRLQIVMLIGSGEACVCHLCEALHARQAYVSQQLMGLRKAGFVETRRHGRHIYYRITDTRLIPMILEAARKFSLDITPPHVPDIPGCDYIQ